MSDFHAAEWEKKYEIAEKISDIRSREFAKRVIYNEKPEYLPKKEIRRREKEIAEKILSMDKCTWNTIPAAMNEIDNLRESDEEIDMNRLEEIDAYIQELDEYHRAKLDG